MTSTCNPVIFVQESFLGISTPYNLINDKSQQWAIDTVTVYITALTVLSVRFEVHVGVSLLLAPEGAVKGGPKAPFPLVRYAGIHPVNNKR